MRVLVFGDSVAFGCCGLDGVHPNTKGHELFFKIVRDYLIRKKVI